MEAYQAVVLGIVQGLTEILPISSSGHLILVPGVLGWPVQPLSFDAALHLGTALALLAFFGKDWIDLIRSRSFRMIAIIFLASVPVGLAGLLGGDFIEEDLREPKLVVGALVGVSFLMLLVEWVYRRRGEKRVRLGLGDAFVIGAAQVLALFPGVSRSGITILTGMSRGLEREKAARFSFLISLPIVFAAGLWELFSVYRQGAMGEDWFNLGIGIGTSFAVALFAVKFLLGILRRSSLVPFAIYRILLGIALLVFL